MRSFASAGPLKVRAAGRDSEARALDGHDGPADGEDLELAAFRRDIEREFVLVQLHEESHGDDTWGPRGPR